MTIKMPYAYKDIWSRVPSTAMMRTAHIDSSCTRLVTFTTFQHPDQTWKTVPTHDRQNQAYIIYIYIYIHIYIQIVVNYTESNTTKNTSCWFWFLDWLYQLWVYYAYLFVHLFRGDSKILSYTHPVIDFDIVQFETHYTIHTQPGSYVYIYIFFFNTKQKQ